MQCIGVIGAGQMGTGIAQICAVSGYDVRLLDVSTDRLDQARDIIQSNLDRQVSRGRIDADQVSIAL